jgi:hypothetical protein
VEDEAKSEMMRCTRERYRLCYKLSVRYYFGNTAWAYQHHIYQISKTSALQENKSYFRLPICLQQLSVTEVLNLPEEKAKISKIIM